MNTSERDLILVTLDTRSKLLESQSAEDHKEIKETLATLNGKVRGNEVRSKVNQALISVLLLGFGAGITKLVDIW